MSTSIVFVDSRLTDYQTLIASLAVDQHEIVLIDGDQDGLAQIAAALNGRSGIDAIHLLSHGSAGSVQIGTSTLNSANLNTYAEQLASIGQSLSEDGDLLLYGCNTGAGEAGQAFIESIAHITQADVAASTDLTGAAALGGDWVLEASAGAIEAGSLALTDYASVLPELTQPAGPAGTVTYPEVGNYTSGEILSGGFYFEVLNVPAGVTFRLLGGAGPNLVATAPVGAFLITDNQTYDFSNVDTNKIVLGWTVVVDWATYTTGDLSFIYQGVTQTYTFTPVETNTAPIAGDYVEPVAEGNSAAINLADLTTDAETTDSNQLTYTGTGVAPGATVLNYTAPTNPALKGTVNSVASVVYTATDSDGASDTGTVTFNVIYLDDAPTGSVTATGTSKVSEVLTATNNISDVDDGGAGVSKSYQWQAYNTTNNTWEAISGATSSTFTPAADDANKLVRVKITAGSPATDFFSDVRLIAPTTGPGLISTTGLTTPIIVKDPSGDTEIANNDPVPSTTGITLDGPTGGSTVTTTSNGPVTVANPGGDNGGVTIDNQGTGTTTVTGIPAGEMVTPQGPGPIIIETSANPGITVNDAAPAGNLTITNTGGGTVNVTPVGTDGGVTVGPTSTGPITLGNPTGSTTVTNNGTSAVTVNNLTTPSTVTSNGTGSGGVTVASPAGDLTLTNNTNTSTLTTTGLPSGSTVTTPGTGPTAVSNPAGSFTVNNTGTGTSTVTGTPAGSTVTAQGSGAVVVNSVLSAPDTITVDAAGNQNNVTVDNDGTGSVNVTNLTNGGSVTSTGNNGDNDLGTGITTVVNPTGSITVANTGTNAVNVTGLDDTATLTTTGTGPTTVTNPDGSGTIHNTGSGLVTVTGVLDGKTFTTDSTGPTTVSNPAGDLTLNNTGAGTVTASGLGNDKTITTNGTQPVGISSPAGNLTVVNTGTGLDTVTGLLADKTVTTTGSGNTTVSDPGGNVTLHNTGAGTLTATGVNHAATVTITGTSATSITDPDGIVTVINTGTGVVTVAGKNGFGVTTQGTGPITATATGNTSYSINAADNQNLTLDNDGTGGLTANGITTGSTITNTGTGSGFTYIHNPTGTGTLTVNNTGTNTLTVTGLDTGATLTNSSTSTGPVTLSSPDSGTTNVNNQSSSTVTITGAPSAQVVNTTGSGATNVNDPAAGLTLHNTGTGTLTATGVNNNQTVITTGTTATTIQNPDGNVTVNNTGTGVATVNGTTNGSTVTTQGTGPITVNSVLTAGNTITVAAASNTNLTVDNDNAGAVNVTGVTNGSTINSTGSGAGTTTVVTPTGNLTVNNTGDNIVTVTGFDNNKTLTTPGMGPVTVSHPDGNLFLSNSGTGTVAVTSINIGSTLTVNSGANGPVNVTSPDGNVNVINNSTQLVTVSSVANDATVNCTGSGPQTVNLAGLTAGQSVTIDNDGTGLVNLTNVPYGVTVFFTGTGPTTVSSFSGDPSDGAAVLENLTTSLVTVANGATGVDGGTINATGSGPIKFDTDVTNGESMTVNIAENTNVTFDNDGAGTVNVAGAPNATTITSSSGAMTVTNPTGNLTVNNSANGTLNVTGFDNDKTLALNTSGATTVTNPVGNLTLVYNGTGSITVEGTAGGGATLTTASSQNTSVTNPGGNLTVVNSGSGTVSVSGLNDNATLNATGTGATTLTSPDTDASFTVNNTGTGLVSVSGIADGKTITTQGTGQIAINSALGVGEKINVNSTDNDNIQITNTGAGQVDVLNSLALDTNDVMSFTLTGNNTTIVNLTGTLDLGSAPLTLNLASGYTPVVGHTITLIANDDADAITGTFAGKAEGSTVQVGNYLFTINYAGGTDNNDVVLTMTGSAPTGGGGSPDPASTSPTPPAPPPVTPPLVVETPPSTDTSSPPTTTVIVDGVVVSSTTTTSTTTVTDQVTGEQTTITTATVTTTIPIVTESRQEENPSTPMADIPLATNTAGEVLLQASLPVGVGMSSQAVTGGTNQTLRELLIAASEPRTDQSGFGSILGQGIDSFVPGVRDQNQVTVRTITFETAPTQSGAFAAPIVITGASGTGEQNAAHPDRQEALVIDVRNLPSGTVLQLNNVEFAIIIGAIRVTGGNGQNFAVGDNAAQYMVLGAEDDVLRGGGGDDVIGSRGGDDQLFGDEGNDLLVGGIGDDHLEGGDGDDILQGGSSDAGTWTFALNGQGEMVLRFTAQEVDLAAAPNTVWTHDWTLPAAARGANDSRIALIEQDHGTLTDIALLYQAILGQLPDTQSINTIANLGLSDQAMVQIAYDYFVAQTPATQTRSVEAQVRALIETVWGSASQDIVAIGVDYINQGGHWADGLFYLARHANNRDKLTDAQGLLQLTQPLVVGETGWSPSAGNNQLFGGAGQDLLVGGFGDNLLDGGEGLDMAAVVGTLNDYTLARQNPTAGGLFDLLLTNSLTNSVYTLRSVELLRVGGEIYTGTAQMPALPLGETKPLAEFVQLVGVAELQALGVPAGWLG